MAGSFNVVPGLWRSAYSADAYRTAAAGGTGRMLGYLALMIAVAAAVTAATVSVLVGRVARQYHGTRWWEANMPVITIAGGQASSDAAQPFRRELSPGTEFIMDTTGNDPEVGSDAGNIVVLTKTQLIIRQQGRGQTRVYDLSRFPDMELNQQTVGAWLDNVARWAWAASWLGLVFWFWTVKLFQVLFWSVLGLIVNAVSGRRLRYGALFNIGVFALTVPWAFDLLLLVTQWRVPLANVVSFLLYIGYLIWGILVQPKAAASASAEPAHVS